MATQATTSRPTRARRLPLRLAIANDHELIVRGLRAMVSGYRGQVEVVELDQDRNIITEVDVALYDTFAPKAPTPDEVAALCRNRHVGKVVVYSWNMSMAHVQTAAALGAVGYLSKALSARELVDALVRIHRGERVYSPATDDEIEQIGGDWPGRIEGLSNREAEVLTLIVRGLSNDDIAARLYLSPNSVKSYIRSCYAKIGVTRRSQAVKWGIEHGFSSPPDHEGVA